MLAHLANSLVRFGVGRGACGRATGCMTGLVLKQRQCPGMRPPCVGLRRGPASSTPAAGARCRGGQELLVCGTS